MAKQSMKMLSWKTLHDLDAFECIRKIKISNLTHNFLCTATTCIALEYSRIFQYSYDWELGFTLPIYILGLCRYIDIDIDIAIYRPFSGYRYRISSFDKYRTSKNIAYRLYNNIAYRKYRISRFQDIEKYLYRAEKSIVFRYFLKTLICIKQSNLQLIFWSCHASWWNV